MLTLQSTELVDKLEQAASAESITAEELLNKIVGAYLSQLARHKIMAEGAAFRELHPQLIPQYLGSYVAIHNGKVVAHDSDLRELHLRIRKEFGQTPILLRQVTPDIDQQDLIFRSPKPEMSFVE